jgi:predicted nucleic acid-binding protein
VSIVIFDTSVLIDDLRSGCHQSRIQSLSGIVRFSSVVVAELLRGAVTQSERDFVSELAENRTILTPAKNNWIESGEILRRMRSDLGFTAQKLRELHFDVLIALTARAHGARLITSNRADFEAIHRYRSFELEVW